MLLSKLKTINLPKAVCFDLDNTLYSYNLANNAGMEAVYKKIYDLFSIKKNDAEIYFNEARRQVKENLGNIASSHNRLIYFQYFMEIIGLKTQPAFAFDLEQTFWRVYLKNAKLYDGVKDLLYILRSKNIIISIITDLTSQIQFRKLIYFDIDHLIDYVITSEEAGEEKPSPKIFTLALKKMRLQPKDIWMIGDDFEKDYIGAKHLNIFCLIKQSDKNIQYNDLITYNNISEIKMFFENR